MTTGKKPRRSDVDLAHDDVRLPDGTRLTEHVAEQIVVDVRRKIGRPSLNGEPAVSPRVSFRLTPETRERAERIAEREGKSISQLAREALEAHIKAAS